MMLASIEGAVGAAAITLIILAVQWLGGRFVKLGGKNGAQGPGPEKSEAAMGARNNSEEERMRRFLEALGIPADAQAEPPPQISSPMRQTQQKRSELKPPPLPSESVFPKPAPQRHRTPQLPKRQAPVPSSKPVPMPLDQASAPKIPAGQIRLNDLRTSEFGEFQTITSGISAIPGEKADKRATEEGGERNRESTAGTELWREALQSPQALRSAFILQEILGSPKGLQSTKGAPNFPSL